MRLCHHDDAGFAPPHIGARAAREELVVDIDDDLILDPKQSVSHGRHLADGRYLKDLARKELVENAF